MSLWSTPAGPIPELRVPKRLRFSKRDLARVRRALEKRLKPYQTKITAHDLAQPVP